LNPFVLLDMKFLEVSPIRKGFEPRDRLRHSVDRLLAVPQSFSQIGEIPAFDSLV
jgi:hypothetical protein